MPTSIDLGESTMSAPTAEVEAAESTSAPPVLPFLPPIEAGASLAVAAVDDGPVEVSAVENTDLTAASAAEAGDVTAAASVTATTDAAATAAAAVEAVAAQLDGTRDTAENVEGGQIAVTAEEARDDAGNSMEEGAADGNNENENVNDENHAKQEGQEEGTSGSVNQTDNENNEDNEENEDNENNHAKQRPAIRGRKDELTCRCIKSKCLKLYCDCFRRNKLCDANCVCLDCHNTEEESGPEGKRTAMMIQILKRNPHAFDDKVLEGKEEEIEVLKEKAEEERGGHPRGKRGRPKTRPEAATSSKRRKRKEDGPSDPNPSENAETAAAGEQPDKHEAQTQQTQQSQPPKKKRRTRRRTSASSITPANLEHDPELQPTPDDPTPIPFTLEEHPELQLDDTRDHSKLVHAFKQPLFPKDPSPVLSIAYSHHKASKAERSKIRKKKLSLLSELETLRNQFYAKKAELLQANALLKQNSQTVGKWTRKIFDLELREPCTWNSKLEKLKEYVQLHGGPPEHSKKVKGDETEKALVTWITGIKIKVKKEHSSVKKFPHRIEALEDLGVTWENENEARFEVMFQKLLDYRKEMGSFRMPSLDLCKESGDEELVQLHNWVFSQVGSIRYQLKNKKVEVVKRFLDVGFSFEKWYGTNGHVFERDIKSFDVIARRFVESGGTILDGRDPEEDEQEKKKTDGEEGITGDEEKDEGQTQSVDKNGENVQKQDEGQVCGNGGDGENLEDGQTHDDGEKQDDGQVRDDGDNEEVQKESRAQDDGEDGENQEEGRSQDNEDDELKREEGQTQDDGQRSEMQEGSQSQGDGKGSDEQEVEGENNEDATDDNDREIEKAQENSHKNSEETIEAETPAIEARNTAGNDEKTTEAFVDQNAAEKNNETAEGMETTQTEVTRGEIDNIREDEEMVDPPVLGTDLADGSDMPLDETMTAELPEESSVKMEDDAADSQHFAMAEAEMMAEPMMKEEDDMQLDGDLGGMEGIAAVDDNGEEMDVEDVNATGAAEGGSGSSQLIV